MSLRSSQDAETGVMIPVTADKTYEVRGGVRISFELSQALTPAHTWPSSTPLPRPGKLGASGTPSTRTWFFIEVPARREAKRPKVLTMAWRRFAKAGLTRDDVVVGAFPDGRNPSQFPFRWNR